MRRSAVIGSLGALVVVAATMVTVTRRESPSAIAAPAFSTADVADEFVAGGNWRAAVSADWLPDGRMIVIRTTGEVMVVTPTTGSSVNLMTIPNLLTTGESGLLDVAVDPSFATNNRFYTYSVSSATRRLQIDRFTLSASGATTLASRQTIWTNPGPAAVPDYHVGGSLNISPDGKFFLSTGDNTEGPNSQSLTNVFGKVLRINLDGTLPAGNPFADGAGPNIDEIWARGLRNAFRSSFDNADSSSSTNAIDALLTSLEVPVAWM